MTWWPRRRPLPAKGVTWTFMKYDVGEEAGVSSPVEALSFKRTAGSASVPRPLCRAALGTVVRDLSGVPFPR